MKIVQSGLESQSAALQWQRQHSEESLRLEVRAPAAPPPPPPSTQVELSPRAMDASQAKGDGTEQDLKLQILISVVEMLTGRRIKLFDASELTQPPAESGATESSAPVAAAPSAPPAPEISLHYEARSVREEAEAAHYEARGKVTTADGRQFDFSVALDMARYEYEESSVVMDAGNARPKDPLILNLGTDRVRLEASRFSFDLEGDGKKEQVARLGAGSFFLALDRDGNGKIDSGKELFGPGSGDGFADLAQLDEDGNGWIDEGDSAFSRLSLWRPDEELQSVQEAGVGAIALDRRATPFTLKTADGETAGAIRSTGLYLTEAGSVGTVQQIDVMV